MEHISSSSIGCAPCKHQTKKCKPHCIMREHFPANRFDDFKGIQKLFGVANMIKIIREAGTEEARKEAAKSLYWEAEMWTKDSIQGPYGYYLTLEQELTQYRRNPGDDDQLQLQGTQEMDSSSSTCAVCKYQRIKCPPDCFLRTHFPVNREDDFKAVQKLFGIGNVKKMIREVISEEDRKEVVKSIYWEAEMWAKDPVQGPYGCYLKLEQELSQYKNPPGDQLLQGSGIDLNLPYSENDSGVNGNPDLINYYAATNCGVQENQDFSLTSGGVSRERGLPAEDQSRFWQQQHDHQAAAIEGKNMRDGVMVPFGNGIGLESGHNNVSDRQKVRMNEQGAEMQVIGNSGTKSSSGQVAADHEWLTL